MDKGTTGQTIKLYLHILKRYRASSIANVLVLICAVVLVDILAPFLIAKALSALSSYATHGATIAPAEHYFGLFVVVTLLGMLGWRIVGYWISLRQSRLVYELETFVFDRLTLHSYTFFVNQFGGALVTSANRFVRGYQTLEDTFYFSALGLVTRLVASVIVLTIAIPSIGIALLVWSLFFIGSTAWMVRKKMPLTKKAAETDSTITARLADVIGNILNLKSFGRRKDEVESFRRVSDTRRRIQRRSWLIDETVWTYTSIMGNLFAILTLWLSIRAVMSGSAGIAVVLLAEFYVIRTSGDLQSLQDIMHRGSKALGDAAEMTAILNAPPDIQDVSNPKPLKVSRGELAFDHITFAYDGAARVFKDFALTISPGERVGLVGHSGSGKSTLARLLLRFAEVERGRITIDGQDITKVAQDDLRSHVGYVAQEPILFHRSLAKNIRYSRPDASDAEVREVARLAHADEFIEALPHGYDTLVGERGVKLSGGEKQRVAIARAMLSKAPILVLDEATSSLDSKSERLITDALRHLMKQRTTLVIAHRLSTIQSLDRIVVLDHGKIVEQGTHRQLLARKGYYYQLWQHQTGGFLDD